MGQKAVSNFWEEEEENKKNAATESTVRRSRSKEIKKKVANCREGDATDKKSKEDTCWVNSVDESDELKSLGLW